MKSFLRNPITKYKYTAKIYLQDGETIINTGDDIEEFVAWINNQAEASFDEVNAEIIDTLSNQARLYLPPSEL